MKTNAAVGHGVEIWNIEAIMHKDFAVPSDWIFLPYNEAARGLALQQDFM